MKNFVNQFKGLHQLPEPLLLGNVWNVQSARVFEKLNFRAIGTSSAAVAETLGYSDGEDMPREDYFFMVRRIKQSTTIPLTVDLEAGYGATEEEIVGNIKQLADWGVVGINLEDSVVKNTVREIVNVDSFARKLQVLTARLQEMNVNIFINVRCDAFLLNLPEAKKEAIKRMAVYEKTGVHGIFLPCITNVDDIKATVSSTKLPVNVMCMPDLPGFDVLKSAGVKRISVGPFMKNSIYGTMEKLSRAIVNEKNFSCLFLG